MLQFQAWNNISQIQNEQIDFDTLDREKKQTFYQMQFYEDKHLILK